MSFNIEFTVTDKGYILITTHGEYTKSSSQKVIETIKTLRQKHKIRFFMIDHRDITLCLNTSDIYSRPNFYEEIWEEKNVVIAHIASLTDKEAFSFFENVVVNRGYEMRVFYTLEAAKDWLQTHIIM